MRKDDEVPEQELEQLQKDVATLFRLVKNIEEKLKRLQTDIDFKRQAEQTPRFGLTDPVRPSPLGKNLGDWYERLTNKTGYPIANPEDGQ